MTLHEAIIGVLKENSVSLTAQEIADYLNRVGYYKKKDNTEIKSNQVSARINKYPLLFQKDISYRPMQISLRT